MIVKGEHEIQQQATSGETMSECGDSSNSDPRTLGGQVVTSGQKPLLPPCPLSPYLISSSGSQ